METFSGIPVRALLENVKETTKLDLHGSGCGVLEACVLSHCLKVVFLFVCLVASFCWLCYYSCVCLVCFLSIGRYT